MSEDSRRSAKERARTQRGDAPAGSTEATGRARTRRSGRPRPRSRRSRAGAERAAPRPSTSTSSDEPSLVVRVQRALEREPIAMPDADRLAARSSDPRQARADRAARAERAPGSEQRADAGPRDAAARGPCPRSTSVVERDHRAQPRPRRPEVLVDAWSLRGKRAERLAAQLGLVLRLRGLRRCSAGAQAATTARRRTSPPTWCAARPPAASCGGAGGGRSRPPTAKPTTAAP